MLACLHDSAIEHGCPIESRFVKKTLKQCPSVLRLTQLQPKQPLPKPEAYDQETSNSLLIGRGNALDLNFIERFETKFAPLLNEELAFSCRLILNELMQNSVDHSNAERYLIYGGSWPSPGPKEIHIGVLDMGVSIPAKLEQKYDLEDDVQYLEFAMKEGTSTRRQRPGGLGLFLAFEHLKSHAGTLTILSRNAEIIRYFKNKRIVRKSLKYPLHGTWCLARFPAKSE